MTSVEDKERHRSMMLRVLYQHHGPHLRAGIQDLSCLLEEMDLSAEEAVEAADYLADEYVTLHSNQQPGLVALTKNGIRAAERAITQEKQIVRLAFLKALYEQTEAANRLARINYREIGRSIGVEGEESELVARYLVDEGLAEWAAMGGMLAITHWGVLEVEQALGAPERPTEHFPPINYIHIEGGLHGQAQLQQGTTDSTQSQRVQVLQPNEVDRLQAFVNEYRQQLQALDVDPEVTAEAEAELATIEAHLQSPKPKKVVIVESLRTLRSIAEGAAGGLMTSLMIETFNLFGA